MHNFFDDKNGLQHQNWRGFEGFSKVHKKRRILRAGEAGEQARALGVREGGVLLPNCGLSRVVLMRRRSSLARVLAGK
ncbi:hypothetical protein C2U51_15195 [Enterobacteriaceae bacterium ENNIH1]|nr:hypothetical protein C2U51_15195 [Enterobacteriaceae bacterium ENNIH1]